jgi:hypothetical protein
VHKEAVRKWDSVASTERMAGKQRSGDVVHKEAVRKWGSVASTERMAGKQRSGDVVLKEAVRKWGSEVSTVMPPNIYLALLGCHLWIPLTGETRGGGVWGVNTYTPCL